MKTGIAPDLDLSENYVIQFTALDASTGAVVSGVTVSDASILVENVREGDLTPAVPDEGPLWLAIPDDMVNG